MSPYRDHNVSLRAKPTNPSYSWPWRLLSRVLVRLKVWQRYVAVDSNGILDRSKRPSFDSLAEAVLSLQYARDTWSLVSYDCTGLHVLDRRTGVLYSPSPEEIEVFLEAGRCPVCKAAWDERCDAPLHG